LNNIWFVPGITFAYDFSQFSGWVFKEVCGSFFLVGVYPFLPRGFVNSQSMKASEVIHCLWMKMLHVKKQ